MRHPHESASQDEGSTYHSLLGRESLASLLQGWFLRKPNPDGWREGGPTLRLVVGGGHDALFEWQEMAAMADRIGAQRYLFPEMGHDLMLGAGAWDVSQYITC